MGKRRKGAYIESLDSNGVVFERIYSPQKAKPVSRPQAPRPQAPRPQAPKVKPVPQGRPPGLSDESWAIYNLGKSERNEQTKSQLEWFKIMNQTAEKSQLSNQRFGLQLQSTIGTSNENVARIQGTSAGKVAETQGRWGLETQKEQTTSNLGVAEIQGRTSLGVAATQAGASNYDSDNELKGVQYKSDADKYISENQFKGIKYQSDTLAATENKKTDSNFFIEREKNATQREKNKQDLFLNAGLGILDSINKQRASSSQAAAQIYSSYLSSNPYNFKYWD